jgi:hypothetical protein
MNLELYKSKPHPGIAEGDKTYNGKETKNVALVSDIQSVFIVTKQSYIYYKKTNSLFLK